MSRLFSGHRYDTHGLGKYRHSEDLGDRKFEIEIHSVSVVSETFQWKCQVDFASKDGITFRFASAGS